MLETLAESVCLAHFLGVYHNGEVALAGRNKDTELLLIFAYSLKNARITFENARNNRNIVADSEAEFILFND